LQPQRLLHREAGHPHREAGQRLGQLARLVEHGGGQPGGGADNLGDLTSHGNSLPHRAPGDTPDQGSGTPIVALVSSAGR